MHTTRTHLSQLAGAIGLIGIALNIASPFLDRDAGPRNELIQMLAPALLYAFALWLWLGAMPKTDLVRKGDPHKAATQKN